jgi:hypothetical protein
MFVIVDFFQNFLYVEFFRDVLIPFVVKQFVFCGFSLLLRYRTCLSFSVQVPHCWCVVFLLSGLLLDAETFQNLNDYSYGL